MAVVCITRFTFNLVFPVSYAIAHFVLKQQLRAQLNFYISELSAASGLPLLPVILLLV